MFIRRDLYWLSGFPTPQGPRTLEHRDTRTGSLVASFKWSATNDWLLEADPTNFVDGAWKPPLGGLGFAPIVIL